MLTTTKQNAPKDERAAIRALTPDAVAEIGLQTHVYVRAIDAGEVAAEVEGQIEIAPGTTLYAVHAANGTRVAIVDSREGAFQGARAYGYEPLSVH